MTHYTIGVDISKAHLDAHRLPDGEARQFSNDKRGMKAFIGWIGEGALERIVYEPTGAYHRSFQETLSAAGLPIARVNRCRQDDLPKLAAPGPRPTRPMPAVWRQWVRPFSRNCIPCHLKNCAISRNCKSSGKR